MAGNDEASSLRARLTSALGLRTARIYRPVTGDDEPEAPPPGRASASPAEETGQQEASQGDPGAAS